MADIRELQKVIDYSFKDEELLKTALTHSSFANEKTLMKHENYERTEFLGDAVLELVSSDFLFKNNPDMPEGILTKTRSSMVCEMALAYCAREFKLQDYILLGKGEEFTGGRERDSIISDVMESLIGAIYLDGGLEEAGRFINRFILSDLEHKQVFYDAKTILQEKVQKKYKDSVRYELISAEGPEHLKTFKVRVIVGDAVLAEGSGKSKKSAEQQAAYLALNRV